MLEQGVVVVVDIIDTDNLMARTQERGGNVGADKAGDARDKICLLYTSPSPRDGLLSRMPSSA